MKVKLVSQTTGTGEFQGRNAEELITYCARVSSSRKDKFEKPEGLLKYCLNHGHYSIFEQAVLTFEVQTSITVSRHILRHWTVRPQELSGRYAEIPGMETIEIRMQAESNRQSSTEVVGSFWIDERGPFAVMNPFNSDVEDQEWILETASLMNKLRKKYEEGLARGYARECVRQILPLASTTNMFLTANVRTWIHFFQARDSEHAQKETREVAQAIKEIFKQELPIISKALNY